MKLKAILPILLCCTLPNVILAQKCKFDKEDKDPFTNEMVRSEMVKFGKKLLWWANMEQNGQKYYATFYIGQHKDMVDMMTKGTKILLKLENGTIVTLETTSDQSPIRNVEGLVIVTQWTPKIELTKEQLQQLSSSPTENIRTYISGKELYPPEISGKQGRKMMDIAHCLLENK